MDQELKALLIELLQGGSAHLDCETILRNFPKKGVGEKPNGFSHSAWELLEHMRIAQRDILDYCLNPKKYETLVWPDDYWPEETAPKDSTKWDKSIEIFIDDRNNMVDLIHKTKNLLSPLAPDISHSVCREAMVLADHNSYHSGQIVTLQKYLEKQ